MKQAYVYDIEVFPNCFVAVFKNIRTQDFEVFGLWEHKGKLLVDDRKRLLSWMSNKNIYMGFMVSTYDAPILDSVYCDPDNIDVAQIKALSDSIINSDDRTPLVPSHKLIGTHIDLYKIWHYDNPARRTSLKWLEFVFRSRSIKDLPYSIDSNIKSQTAYDNVVDYCKKDVDETYELYKRSVVRIKARYEVKSKFGFDAINMSDSSMGERIILENLARRLNTSIKNLRNKHTDHKKIKFADLIDDKFRNRSGIVKTVIDEHFDLITVTGTKSKNSGRMVFDLRGNLKEYQWRGIEFVVGAGGIHGCVPKGLYESDDDNILCSADVTSQYPNRVIGAKIYPAHLGPVFVKTFKEDVYDERGKYPKATAFSMNMTYKLACNAAVGKFNSEWSPLYDPPCNLRVTLNCQLAILSLAEDITDAIPGSKLIMLNTDGLEVMVPRQHKQTFDNICNDWEQEHKFALEHIEYQKLAVYNVNNYLAVTTDEHGAKVKRKGLFCTYDDMMQREEYHKNPSATIIPLALSEYFEKGIPIEDTINNCDNIHEFLYGVKKTKAFRYALIIANSDRTVKFKKFDERVFRYYISTSPKSGNLVKLWFDGRITGVNKGQLVKDAMRLRTTKTSSYGDLDRQYYIDKAHEIRSDIEFQED